MFYTTLYTQEMVASVAKVLPYFLNYKMHFSPQIWEENGGASYSLNVAYLTHAGGGGSSRVRS